jgi:hypothetical protein
MLGTLVLALPLVIAASPAAAGIAFVTVPRRSGRRARRRFACPRGVGRLGTLAFHRPLTITVSEF